MEARHRKKPRTSARWRVVRHRRAAIRSVGGQYWSTVNGCSRANTDQYEPPLTFNTDLCGPNRGGL